MNPDSANSRVTARTSVTRTSERSLSLKTNLDCGEEGMPLDQLPEVAEQVRREHEQVLETAATAVPQNVGRNDPCPCGSGKKYKKCCLPRDEARARQTKVVSPPPDANSPLPAMRQ